MEEVDGYPQARLERVRLWIQEWPQQDLWDILNVDTVGIMINEELHRPNMGYFRWFADALCDEIMIRAENA